MRLIIKKISNLVTCAGKGIKKGKEQRDAKIIENGYVIVNDDIIEELGSGDDYKKFIDKNTILIDGAGKTVTPGLVDPHTHVVYAGSRENELPLKLNKVSYIDILKAGGGILSTVENTRKAADADLFNESKKRLDTMLLHGTTTIESKSGYGLNFKDEVKILEVNRMLSSKHPIDVVSTYLGAHAVPLEFKDDREGYINLMINKVIPYVAEKKLAEFIDCFLEEGVFSLDEAERILKRGRDCGLKLKVHADEIVSIKGAELSGKLKATSAEHLVAISEAGIREMAENNVIAVLLPSTSFYLMLNKFAPGRKMIDENLAVALATDCNPGTSPTENLQNVMTYACFGMGLLPEEIINAVTINAAYAIGRGDSIGSIENGKKADLVIFNSKNLNYLIYHFGVNAVDKVIKNGKIAVENSKIKEKFYA
ncbi:MAG: imidazolonepropionase [Clostridiaceae bacterium]